MMGVPSAGRDARARDKTSKRWWCAWPKRTESGGIAACRVPYGIWDTSWRVAPLRPSSHAMVSNPRLSGAGKLPGRRYLRRSVKREEADFSQPRRNDSRHLHRLGEVRPREIPFGPAEQVDLFPVRLAIFPAAVENTHPFKCQRPDGRVM